MKMRLLQVLLIAAIGISAGAYVAQEPSPVQSLIIQGNDTMTLLDRARRSTCMVTLPAYNSGGSAVLVSRKKIDDNQYKYRALTAHHVVKDMVKAFAKDKLEANHDLLLMLQQEFHGAPIRIKLIVDDIPWAVLAHDWAVITFTTVYKLDCVEVATEEEFRAIKPFEKIYAVAYAKGYGQHCREGIIGTTHNEHWNVESQMKEGTEPWYRLPNYFFRPQMSVWYGDSGGGVFNKDGKLIGIINAFGIMAQTGFTITPVTHSPVALKTYLIRDVVRASKNFFLVEG